jgi:hypothetical protein
MTCRDSERGEAREKPALSTCSSTITTRWVAADRTLLQHCGRAGYHWPRAQREYGREAAFQVRLALQCRISRVCLGRLFLIANITRASRVRVRERPVTLGYPNTARGKGCRDLETPFSGRKVFRHNRCQLCQLRLSIAVLAAGRLCDGRDRLFPVAPGAGIPSGSLVLTSRPPVPKRPLPWRVRPWYMR